MNRGTLTRLGGVALLALATACDDASDEAPRSLLPPVVVTPVSVIDLEDQLEVSGELLARNRAAIAAEVAGRITAIRADEGQAVEAGELILEIDPERRQLELASARAGLREAEAAVGEASRDFARIETLREREIAAQARLDAARTTLEQTRARLAAARAQVSIAERTIRDAQVRAPFAGRIARRHVSRGEFVGIATKLVDLVALDPIEIEFHVAERDSSRVALGQEVLVRVDPFPDELFGAQVTVISPTIDTRTRTLRVLARLENSDGRLRPGLFARADLGVAMREDVLMVPEEAILQRADGSVLYRLAPGNRVQRIPIETGMHRNGFVEVRHGLEPDDVVATRGQASLVDGALVAPRSLDGSPVRSEVAGAPPAEGATP